MPFAYMNNNVLGNAAFAGAFAGALGTAASTGALSPAALSGMKAAAGTLASAIDAAIPWDATISAAGPSPAPIAVQTGTTVEATVTKAKLLGDLVFGATLGRFSTDTTPGDWTALATSIAVAYNKALALEAGFGYVVD